jgi:hypothetical protein
MKVSHFAFWKIRIDVVMIVLCQVIDTLVNLGKCTCGVWGRQPLNPTEPCLTIVGKTWSPLCPLRGMEYVF